MEQASSATETSRRLPAHHGGHSRIPPHLPAAPRRKSRAALEAVAELLAEAGVTVNGERPWDLRFHHPDTAERILARGSLGLGEAYMEAGGIATGSTNSSPACSPHTSTRRWPAAR